MAQLKVVSKPEKETSPRDSLPEPHQKKVPVRWHRIIDLFIVLVAALFMCLYETGGGSFGEGDQTTHSIVVQRMAKSGDLFSPSYDNRPYYNKPPFKMWLATIPVLLLGESNFSYRVIDGLSGVGITLAVFFFSLALFGSRIIAYCSVLTLLGSRLLFYGHGIRNAVQDSMMLFLMTLGTIAGWYLVEAVRTAPPERKRSTVLAIAGGLAVGLAVLTKNVPGYMAFVIVGIFCLLSGEAIRVLKQGWLQIGLALSISLAIPLSYIALQGEYRKLAWQMLVQHEVLKRATTGYHFVNQHWFYWNTIVWDRVTVPPELLALALLFGLYLAMSQRDRRAIFLLTWAIAPVIIQSAVKSKLTWYILPAVPGMTMLVGFLVGQAILSLRQPLGNWLSTGRPPTRRWFFTAAFSFYALMVLAYNVQDVAAYFVNPQRRNIADEMVGSIRAHARASGQTYRAVRYDTGKLTKHEIFYWNMLPVRDLQAGQLSELKEMVQTGQVDFLVTKRTNFDQLLALRPIAGYSFIPARNRRRSWLAVISYRPDFLPKHFTSVSQTSDIANADEMFPFGWKDSSFFLDRWVRPSAGESAGIMIQGDGARIGLGTTVNIGLASVVPLDKAGRGVSVDIFFNNVRVHSLENLAEGFQNYQFHLPGKLWQSGSNILGLRLSLPKQQAIERGRQLILLHKLQIDLKQ